VLDANHDFNLAILVDNVRTNWLHDFEQARWLYRQEQTTASETPTFKCQRLMLNQLRKPNAALVGLDRTERCCSYLPREICAFVGSVGGGYGRATALENGAAPLDRLTASEPARFRARCLRR
jgi:hypothetical protein